ncbi:MAG: hypothetical protein GXP63_00270 [DPANN group archaeon]|nr:hypothetical protein [DPANN group archaeon]
MSTDPFAWKRFLQVTERLIDAASRKDVQLRQDPSALHGRIRYLEDRIKTLEIITRKHPAKKNKTSLKTRRKKIPKKTDLPKKHKTTRI